MPIMPWIMRPRPIARRRKLIAINTYEKNTWAMTRDEQSDSHPAKGRCWKGNCGVTIRKEINP